MPLTGVTHGVVKTPEVDIHYVEAGSGPPVVLIHGWPQHLLSWGRVIPALAERHRVVAVDLRGSGGSSIARGGYDKKTMAGDVRAVVQELGLDGRPWSATIMAAASPTPMPRSGPTRSPSWR
jgi:pimeloyl-ACP methyl ester carboxylesterase